MHPRNPYRNPPDFAALAEVHPGLREHLVNDPSSGRKTIDFKNEEAQRRLTEAIMRRDFGVDLRIPPDRLCPPVPNRMNYVLWIQDIVYAHQAVLGSSSSSRTIRGLDIGTGATAIYPILACKLDPSWEMVATELDDFSFQCAVNNIKSNNLSSRIKVEKASGEGAILFPVESQTFDFAMCNPPFYSSREEITQSTKDKELPPNAVCTGAEIEMIFPHGGEEGFVGRMVVESERLQTRCRWYTSMLGKMSSVSTIVQALKARSITNYALTEFVQGQTRRWAVAWSFSDVHLPDDIARISSLPPKHALYVLMPPRNTLVQPLPSVSVGKVENALEDVLHGIAGLTTTRIRVPSFYGAPGEEVSSFLVEAEGNTWSRSARRKAKGKVGKSGQAQLVQVPPSSSPSSTGAKDIKPALTCSFRIVFTPAPSSSSGDTAGAATGGNGGEDNAAICSIESQWIYGTDRALFESFVGHVGRKVGGAMKARAGT